jgi:hypothetical protein
LLLTNDVYHRVLPYNQLAFIDLISGSNKPHTTSLLQLKALKDGKIYIICSCSVFGVNFCLMDLVANCVVGIV